MKMHSYMTVNGYLQHVSTQSQFVLERLRKATESAGGWEKAILDAKAHRAELDAAIGMSNSGSDSNSPLGTPSIPLGKEASIVDLNTANALRRRLNAVNNLVEPASKQNGKAEAVEKDIPTLAEPHPLIDHSSESISDLA